MMPKALKYLSVATIALAALTPAIAQAYIGPGLGVALVWTLLGPLAALLSVLAILAYFPARYYYKKRKAEKAESEGASKDKGEASKDDERAS